MAKDPAFLFYSSDFLTGTMLMSDEQVGKYIRLLCLQHQQGHLSEEDMLHICGTYDRFVFKKFKKDDDGLYFNERLDLEINKRQAYSESRRNNRMSKIATGNNHMLDICKSYEEHMENENINIDINNISNTESIENKDTVLQGKKKGKSGEIKADKIQFAEYVFMTQKEHDALVSLHGEEAVNWMIQKLDNAKGSKGYKYKSDYRAILSWVVDNYKKQCETNQKKKGVFEPA